MIEVSFMALVLHRGLKLNLLFEAIQRKLYYVQTTEL